MVQMDIPAAFAFAQLFAWCGRKRLQQEEPSISGRFTVIAITYALGVIGPCALYLYGGWPEWETMYWFDAVSMDQSHFGNLVLALVGPLFLLALAISAATGFLLAHRWIRDGRSHRVLLGVAVGLALSVGVVLVTPAAPMFVGHLNNYRAFIHASVASGRPWDYGLVAIGGWVFGVPTAVPREILARYNLITCFNSRFFIPLLVDSLFYFGATAALAFWFHRQQPARVPEPPPPVMAGQWAGREP